MFENCGHPTYRIELAYSGRCITHLYEKPTTRQLALILFVDEASAISANRDLVGGSASFFHNAPQKLILALIWVFAARHKSTHESITSPLLQLRVLRFRLFVDGNVRVGIFPEGEEVFIRGEGMDAGGVGVSAL